MIICISMSSTDSQDKHNGFGFFFLSWTTHSHKDKNVSIYVIGFMMSERDSSLIGHRRHRQLYAIEQRSTYFEFFTLHRTRHTSFQLAKRFLVGSKLLFWLSLFAVVSYRRLAIRRYFNDFIFPPSAICKFSSNKNEYNWVKNGARKVKRVHTPNKNMQFLSTKWEDRLALKQNGNVAALGLWVLSEKKQSNENTLHF